MDVLNLILSLLHCVKPVPKLFLNISIFNILYCLSKFLKNFPQSEIQFTTKGKLM